MLLASLPGDFGISVLQRCKLRACAVFAFIEVIVTKIALASVPVMNRDNMTESNTNCVTICPMTREMCHTFYKDFQNDPAIGHYYEYVYSAENVDRYFENNSVPDRRLFAIMVGDQVVGECKLKEIDMDKRECRLGIHLQDDAVKEKGYGTQAERLILNYAFEEMGMLVVNADAAQKNTRSQHVMEKVGFRYVREDDDFKYYRCERD